VFFLIFNKNKKLNMKYLQRNLHKLKILANCTKKDRNICIKKADKFLIKTLNECVINTLNGKIKLSAKQHKKLNNFKYLLRKFIKNKNRTEKKKILIQQGGFLQYILPGAVTLITTLLEKYLKQ